jgi:hypothetical protein
MLDSLLHETTTTSYEITLARAQAQAARSDLNAPGSTPSDTGLSASEPTANDAASKSWSAPWRTPWLLLWTL